MNQRGLPFTSSSSRVTTTFGGGAAGVACEGDGAGAGAELGSDDAGGWPPEPSSLCEDTPSWERSPEAFSASPFFELQATKLVTIAAATS
jgi:hypothetical protein